MNKEESNDTCLYFHINPLKNHIFYVGIGEEARAKAKFSRNKFWYRTVKKYGYIIDISHKNLSWEEACRLEKLYIKKIGRRDLGLGTLVNLTDGGEGRINIVVSEETRKKMSKAKKGFCLSPESIQKMIESRKGFKFSDATKEKMSKVAKGRIISEEQKEKLRIAHTGRKQSEETIEKRVSQFRGKKRTLEQKENISNSLKGKIVSDEARLNMSKSQMRAIVQLDLEGNFIKEWEGLIAAARNLNISHSGIYKCCAGKTKKYKNYKWMYKLNI